jgi:hypothetical protein
LGAVKPILQQHKAITSSETAVLGKRLNRRRPLNVEPLCAPSSSLIFSPFALYKTR